MKISLFLLPLLCGLSRAALDCFVATYSDITCADGELKRGEPIKSNETNKILNLSKLNGTIDSSTFSLLPHIEELSISECSFSNIDNGALCSLPNLKSLKIYGYNIFPLLTKDLLSKCEHIKELTVSEVKIENEAFKNMLQLEKFTADLQHFEKFTKNYLEGLDNLKTLEFSYSTIENIESGSLCYNPKLEKLVVYQNKAFPLITKDLLKGCENIKYLTVENKQFKENVTKIEENALSVLKNLEELYLYRILMEEIKDSYFSGLEKLKIFSVSECNVKSIQTNAFKDLKNLKAMYLTNGQLKSISTETLAPLINLEDLHLHSQKLETIDNIILPKVELLSVEANNIQKIDTDVIVKNLPNLKHLVIHSIAMPCEERFEVERKLKEKNISTTTSFDPGFSGSKC